MDFFLLQLKIDFIGVFGNLAQKRMIDKGHGRPIAAIELKYLDDVLLFYQLARSATPSTSRCPSKQNASGVG